LNRACVDDRDDDHFRHTALPISLMSSDQVVNSAPQSIRVHCSIKIDSYTSVPIIHPGDADIPQPRDPDNKKA
jgi:hypothetical protein